MDHRFRRLGDDLYLGDGSPAELARLRLDGARHVSVRVLRPFSWDADDRGLTTVELTVAPRRVLVCGPYAAADAAALEVGADLDLPRHPGQDAHRYLAHGTPADERSVHQDSAGWFTLAAETDGGPVAVAVALDYSGTVLTTVEADATGVTVRAELPASTFAPGRPVRLPGMFARVGPGGHEDAEAWLRDLISSWIPVRPPSAGVADGPRGGGLAGPGGLGGPLAPPLVADTWGYGTEITPTTVETFMDAAARLGVEVVTVDKGWETQVGDWTPRPGHAGGIRGLADTIHTRGMALGLWCAAGNAAPESEVARSHPGWLATWRGGPVLLSHGTWALCLGHGPARDHVLGRLTELVGSGVDWLLHDFETIARCDSAEHDHDPGAGEHAAHEGWYGILDRLRSAHPALVVENCWNGGRPLDLAMVARHDTTIGDDWARSRANLVAKLGLGRYLPSSWCSAYMSDEPDLDLSAQLVPYVIGGPWVLMGDLPGWDAARRAMVERGIAVYKAWRSASSSTRVVVAETSAPIASLALAAADGVLAGFLVTPAERGQEVRWYPGLAGDGVLTDEWTGIARRVDADELAAGVVLDTATERGLLVSCRPA